MERTKSLLGSVDDLPAIVSPKDIEKLGFSKAVVYRMFQTPGFPGARIGRRRVVRKEKLVEWLDAGAEQVGEREGDMT